MSASMTGLHSYEQYADLLKAFKQDKPRCSTNKLMTKDELNALIEAEKLYYAEIDGVLWFFVNEGYFYSANFYLPADTAIHMRGQDMDVLVELTGNQTRYNQQWEQELIAAGYEKYDKYLEYAGQLDAVIDEVRDQNNIRREALEKQGCTYRTATKADHPELLKLWEERLDKRRYTITSMTDAELEEMERRGSCLLICDPQGKIVATHMYAHQNKTATGYHVAALHRGRGLGSAVFCRCMIDAYQAGCTKFTAWIREDNIASIRMHRHTLSPSGKFYRQFVYRSGG